MRKFIDMYRAYLFMKILTKTTHALNLHKLVYFFYKVFQIYYQIDRSVYASSMFSKSLHSSVHDSILIQSVKKGKYLQCF